MPAAIPVVAAAGAWLTSGTLAATVVSGALIGAAIGGITAAVTGGDIGKGLLFGAVGGAVTGAATYGLSSVIGSMNTGATTALSSSSETIGGISKTALDQQMAVTSAKALGTTPHISATAQKVVHEGVKQSSWLSKLGTSLGGGFGQAAVGAGIGAIKDVYLAGKAGEIQQGQFDEEMAYKYAQLDSLEKRAGMSGGGGGGGGSGPDYTIDELIRRDREAAGQERKTVLAKVGAELNAQKALKDQDLAAGAAARERMIAGAKVGTGARTGSRSTESLVDIQNRIRAGEGPSGDPNIGVVPPVEYVPPEQVA